MIKRLLVAYPMLVSALFSGAAVAGPSWTSIGKDQLPNYGSAELFIDKANPEPRSQRISGQLHAVLDQPWIDPNASGAYRDIYFSVLADCRERTIAIMPTWPEGPDESSVPASDLKQPAAGTANAKLLQAYCGEH